MFSQFIILGKCKKYESWRKYYFLICVLFIYCLWTGSTFRFVLKKRHKTVVQFRDTDDTLLRLQTAVILCSVQRPTVQPFQHTLVWSALQLEPHACHVPQRECTHCSLVSPFYTSVFFKIFSGLKEKPFIDYLLKNL